MSQIDLFGPLAQSNARIKADINGRAGRDKGMTKAVEHAGDDWSERAYAWLVRYAADRRPFTTMDCRKAAYARGLAKPPTEFAWGAIVNRAVRAGVIRRDGTDNVGDETSHSKLTPVWVAA